MKINISPSNFIEEEIIKDLENGRVTKVNTRFPPEPSGFWYLGHVFAIMINYQTAKKFGGNFNLRLDDTNPKKEEGDFASSYINDLEWLGMLPKKVIYASEAYFSKIYKMAERFIKKGLAYVDDSTAEEVAKLRGTLTEPGVNSPYRNRSIKENLTLFRQMKAGLFDEGSKILRAKIDMASPNMNMRDPAIYRIVKTPHYRVGSKWNVYPMYDFAHPLQDLFEGVTFSLCSLEFYDHRPLYEWVINNSGYKHNVPRQIEFGKLLVANALTGKRYLKELVKSKKIMGWDDPRLLTIVGMRRRGYPANAIKEFIKASGVSRNEGLSSLSFLESFVRDELNKTALRAMAVLDPLKVVITNYNKSAEAVIIENLPAFADAHNTTASSSEKHQIKIGKALQVIKQEQQTHSTLFGREIYIESEDFSENPPPKYNRLVPGGFVRLKGAYIIKCNKVIKNKNGQIDHLECEYIENSKSGNDESGIKVKGTIHFVSEDDKVEIKIRHFKNLIKDEYLNVSKCLNDGVSLDEMLADNTLEEKSAIAESFIANNDFSNINGSQIYQFIRKGYYCLDKDSNKENLIFNETVSLKDGYKVK